MLTIRVANFLQFVVYLFKRGLSFTDLQSLFCLSLFVGFQIPFSVLFIHMSISVQYHVVLIAVTLVEILISGRYLKECLDCM